MNGPGPCHRTTKWDAFAVVGAVLWPVGMFAFGGFDEDAGSAIVAAGSLLVVGSLSAEYGLRSRAARRRLDSA